MLSLVNTRNLTNIHHHGIFFKYQGKRKDPKLRNWYVHWPESQSSVGVVSSRFDRSWGDVASDELNF